MPGGRQQPWMARQHRRPVWREPESIGKQLLGALLAEERGGHLAAPAVSADLVAGTVGATVCIDGQADPVRAREQARNAFARCMDRVGIADAEIVDLRATMLRQPQDAPGGALVTRTEIGPRLEVSCQRAHQLATRR